MAVITPRNTMSQPHKPHKPELDFGNSWEYSPAPETTEVLIKDNYGLYIGGKWLPPSSGKYFQTINPSTEECLSNIAEANSADVDMAVQAAKKALPAWKKLSPKERGKFLFRTARRIQERARELAILETKDGGKPIKESRDFDIPEAAKHFFYYAGWADKLNYAFPGHIPSSVGVCAQIIPWNFPLLMAAWKIAPALACGNTVVLKPAETTSLTALFLAEIFQEIGLPPGVVNIVTGDGSTGAALAEHKEVDKIAFTGSTAVGKHLAEIVAGTGKKISLELGGKSANIIFEDAAIDQAIEGIINSIYFNQGHVCCAGSRLFVQESVYEEVLQKLEIRLKSLRLGDPLDKNTDVGAINSPQQLKIIKDYIAQGIAEGATCHQLEQDIPSRGNWCLPTWFSGVQPAHKIAQEEIFGPVLAVMSFRTPEEAIERANNSAYGLAAGVWTDKGGKILEIASKLEAGVIWCNTYNQFDATSPFGGYKESGFGREGGRQGLMEYLDFGGAR